jgi:sulfate adenylyltransferase large subunit
MTPDIELLRFTTAGSVDDGKSTLIGRLLYDSHAVYEDQLHSVRKATRNQATKGLDLSLLTDGLRAEREQGITIDVAYRYFSTPRRKFIIADTPGHEQYTRNMATGASTADLAVILIDARHGVLPQSRRHAYIARLLGIPRLVAAVNKMDLVSFRQEVFDDIRLTFDRFLGSINGHTAQVEYIPLSALDGDNVVKRSDRTPWYSGPSLLEHLESVPLNGYAHLAPFRFPVQYVIRPDLHFRGFAGQIASGAVHRNDEVRILPSGRTAKVKSIVTYDGDLEEASAPMSVTLQLDREIDVSRGDMIASAADAGPAVRSRFEASLVWMSGRALEPRRPYLLKQGSQTTQARVVEIVHRIDVNDLSLHRASTLGLNEIGTVRVEAQRLLAFDVYDDVRLTGAFILIDPVTNETAGAGMIRRAEAEPERGPVTPVERSARFGHPPFLIALPDGGDDEAHRVERILFDRGAAVARIAAEGSAAALSAGFGAIVCGVTEDQSSRIVQSSGARVFVLKEPSGERLAETVERIWQELTGGN